jgi:hypothetical protein
MGSISSDRAAVIQALAECRTSTESLIREARQFQEILRRAENAEEEGDVARLELKRVVVAEAHSRYLHSTTMLFELLRRK